jgi:hypothetical protein
MAWRVRGLDPVVAARAAGARALPHVHHVRPSCDWASSAYERHSDIARGSKRYTEVWGSVMDHLYAAGDVQRGDVQVSGGEARGVA